MYAELLQPHKDFPDLSWEDDSEPMECDFDGDSTSRMIFRGRGWTRPEHNRRVARARTKAQKKARRANRK